MPVNAILFYYFVNLNTLFFSVLCRLYVYFVSVHVHVIFSYTFTQLLWFYCCARICCFLIFFVFVFVQVAGFACFKPFYVDFLIFRDYTLFIKEIT